MVELVHDEGQVHALQPSVIAPGLAQAVCPEVAAQSDLTADAGDELPGLPPFDGGGIGVVLGVEEEEVFGIAGDIWIGRQVLCQCLTDAVIDRHFVAFAAFSLPYPEASLDSLLVIQEIANPQGQQVRDAQSGVDAYHEQQEITVATLASEQVFDMCDALAVTYWFDEIHAGERII